MPGGEGAKSAPRRGVRNVSLLAMCQALSVAGVTVIMSTSPLVGLELASKRSWATVPIGLFFLATMLTALPAALYMQRVGRRVGFMSASAVAGIGAFVSAYAILVGSFLLFSIGLAVLGTYMAFSQQFRFAAVDAASPLFKSRAMSLVLAGGVVSPFAGSLVTNVTRNSFDPGVFAGCYMALVVAYLLVFALLSWLTIPHVAPPLGGATGRGLALIVRQEVFLVALAGGAVAWPVMNCLMLGTTLAMKAAGFPFEQISMVMKWHIFSMWAPALVTGSLLQRFGVLRIMNVGGLLMLACAGLNVIGESLVHFVISLILLGVGWNFMFIAASRLLADAHQPLEKAKVQGFNDFVVFTLVALSATSTAALFERFGWQMMNVFTAPAVVATLVLTARLQRRRRLAAARQAVSAAAVP